MPIPQSSIATAHLALAARLVQTAAGKPPRRRPGLLLTRASGMARALVWGVGGMAVSALQAIGRASVDGFAAYAFSLWYPEHLPSDDDIGGEPDSMAHPATAPKR